MTTDTLDMAILAKGWTVQATTSIEAAGLGTNRYLAMGALGAYPITLDFKAANVEPPTEGKILIMQARRHGGELWAIRMWPSGRLMLNPGTSASRESAYGYPGELRLGVSYNPVTGALAVAVGDSDGPSETFDLHAHTRWAEPVSDYEILLGAPYSYADQTLLGWTVDCSFRYVEPAQARTVADDYEARYGVLGPPQPWDYAPVNFDEARERWLDRRESLVDLLDRAAALSESVRDLNNERHWEAMLALASGRHLSASLNATELAVEAGALLAAHEQWRREQS